MVKVNLPETNSTDKNLFNSQDLLFYQAFEYAAIGMALVATEGQWLKVNRALCELVGYSEAELLAKTFQDITHPDDLAADLSYVKQMLTGEIQSYQMEKRYFHKQGDIIWILLSVSLVKDPQDRPRYFIAQIQDITKQRITQQELERTQQDLAVRVIDLERTLAEVKELRGLLPICAYCKNIFNDGNYWQKLEEYLQEHTHAQFSHGICPPCLEDQLNILKTKVPDIASKLPADRAKMQF